MNIYQTDPEIESIRHGINKDYEAGITPNSARAEQEAKEDNLDIVFPADNQLQIDIDSDKAYDIFQEMHVIVDKYYGITRIQDRPSRSGLPKRHITIDLRDKVAPYERIALQACLGSDRVREVLGVIQAKFNDPHPTLFLEKKPDAKTLVIAQGRKFRSDDAGSTLPSVSGTGDTY